MSEQKREYRNISGDATLGIRDCAGTDNFLRSHISDNGEGADTVKYTVETNDLSALKSV